jgi:L-threonylcarbamoyladenylate synthase
MKQIQIAKAIDILKKGGVIIFPTDTVWGIGASIESNPGIKKLYQLKNRSFSKPTAVLVSGQNQAKKYGDIAGRADQIISKHWPGALTIIVPAKKSVPSLITAGTDTVGLRAPDHLLVKNLCDRLSAGIVTASANISGNPAPVSKSEIDPSLLGLADMVLNPQENQFPLKIASTIISVTDNHVKTLRRGTVTI